MSNNAFYCIVYGTFAVDLYRHLCNWGQWVYIAGGVKGQLCGGLLPKPILDTVCDDNSYSYMSAVLHILKDVTT